MTIRVILFAQMQALAGTRELSLADIHDTDELKLRVNEIHPGFESQSYIIAVEKEIIQANTKLYDGMTIALLPPYSGG